MTLLPNPPHHILTTDIVKLYCYNNTVIQNVDFSHTQWVFSLCYLPVLPNLVILSIFLQHIERSSFWCMFVYTLWFDHHLACELNGLCFYILLLLKIFMTFFFFFCLLRAWCCKVRSSGAVVKGKSRRQHKLAFFKVELFKGTVLNLSRTLFRSTNKISNLQRKFKIGKEKDTFTDLGYQVCAVTLKV